MKRCPGFKINFGAAIPEIIIRVFTESTIANGNAVLSVHR